MDGNFSMGRNRDEDRSTYLANAPIPRDVVLSYEQPILVTPIEFGSCTYHEAAIKDVRDARAYIRP